MLVVAFAVICLRTGNAWPWHLVVHEDGKRTLLLTILYFEHATRELPLDLVLGVALGGSVFFAFPPEATTPDGRRAHRGASLGWMAAAVIGIIVVGTAIEGGAPMVLDNLLQNHTRPGAALWWGSHWRYHLLSRLALMLASIGLAGLLRLLVAGDQRAEGKVGLVTAVGSVGAYLALTVVFADGPSSLWQPFHDPQYLGHQARELLTHALVTVPVSWGVCVLTAAKSGLAWPERVRSSPLSMSTAVTLIAGAVGVLMAGYVGIAALRADAVSHGQTHDLAMLIFPHFFEHSFTYLLVSLITSLTYEMAARRQRCATVGPK